VKLQLLILVLVLPVLARAEAPSGPVEHPYKSVVYKHEKLTTHSTDKEGKPVDWPQEVFAAFVDLTDPNVRVRVSRGGEDPDFGKPSKPHSSKPPSFKPRGSAPGGFDKAKRHDAKKRPR
jgi:hypothetical protein